MDREERQALRERLAAERLELLGDIERRELAHLEHPPPRRAPPEVVFKDRQKETVVSADRSAGEPPLFDEDQIEAIAAALAEQRQELAAMIDAAVQPVRERLAACEARLETLLTLLGGTNGAKALGARKRVRMLEPPPK